MPNPVEVLEHYQQMKRELLQSSFRQLCEEAHQTAVSRGQYNEPFTIDTAIAHLHSEVTEVYRAFHGDGNRDEETADVVITALSICGYFGIDLGGAIFDKMEKNKLRLPLR